MDSKKKLKFSLVIFCFTVSMVSHSQSFKSVAFPAGKQLGTSDTIWIYPKVETPNSIAVFENYAFNFDTIVVNLKHCLSPLDLYSEETLLVKIQPQLQGKYKIKINLKTFNSIWDPSCTTEFGRHIWYDSIEVHSKFTDLSKTEVVGQVSFIYPNPVKNSFRLGLTNEFRFNQVFIINGLGQTVYISDQPNTEIDISHLKSGLYFLTVFDSVHRKFTFKIIKE